MKTPIIIKILTGSILLIPIAYYLFYVTDYSVGSSLYIMILLLFVSLLVFCIAGITALIWSLMDKSYNTKDDKGKSRTLSRRTSYIAGGTVFVFIAYLMINGYMEDKRHLHFMKLELKEVYYEFSDYKNRKCSPTQVDEQIPIHKHALFDISKRTIDDKIIIYSRMFNFKNVHSEFYIVIVEYENNAISNFGCFLAESNGGSGKVFYFIPPKSVAEVPVDKSFWKSPKAKDIIEESLVKFTEQPDKPTTGQEI